MRVAHFRESLTLPRGPKIVASLGVVLLVLALAATASAKIQFRAVQYPINGLPSYLVQYPVVLSDGDPNATTFCGALLAGTFDKPGTARSLYIVEFSHTSAAVRQELLSIPSEKQPFTMFIPGTGTVKEELQSAPALDMPLSAADLNCDGHDELFAIPRDPALQRAFAFRDNRYVEMDMPFPKIIQPIPAWIDINADSYPDLVLFSNDPNAKTCDGMVYVNTKVRRGMVYINRDGRLLPEGVIEVPEIVDSTQVVDVNGDGQGELLVYPVTSLNLVANATRVFEVRDGTLQEIEGPLYYKDVFVGVDDGFTSGGDINGDGKTDLFMTGWWHSRIGKSFSMVYLQMPSFGDALQFDYGLYTQRHEDILPEEMPSAHRHVLEDLDGDGDPDLLLWDTWGGVACLENRGGAFHLLPPGQWIPAAAYDPDDYGQIAIPADFNADGRLDLLTFPTHGPGLKPVLLLNTSSSEDLETRDHGRQAEAPTP